MHEQWPPLPQRGIDRAQHCGWRRRLIVKEPVSASIEFAALGSERRHRFMRQQARGDRVDSEEHPNTSDEGEGWHPGPLIGRER